MGEKDAYRVKVTLGDATVEVEGAREGVVDIVKALSEVLGSAASGRPATEEESKPATRTTAIATDIRTFFASKAPRSHTEAAAVTAFYYQYLAPETERRDTIDRNLLQEAFRKAKRRLPKVPGQVLPNAKGAGYLDSAGEPGSYRLNPVGYNLVEHTLGQKE